MGKGIDNRRYREMEVAEGVFIPDYDVEYPEDNSSDRIVKVRYDGRDVNVFDENYPYLDDSLSFKIQNFINQFLLRIIVVPLNNLRYGVKVKGKENLKPFRKLFKNGAMTVCNHVYRWDLVCVLRAMGIHRT